LGLGAHAADALGSKRIRPWANYITKRELKLLLILGLVLAYSIGLYYIVNYVPFLALIAISEGFFLFAYNFELFGGFFHNNFWFAISWGAIPLLAGFVMQTDSIAISAIMLSFLTGCVSYIEIRLSREYKALKRTRALITKQNRLEISLKAISLGTIAVTIASVIVSYFCSGHISLST
jgi:hypothetical protein